MHELTPHEWQRTRGAFTEVMGDKPWITSVFELQSVCCHLGLTPSLEDMEDFVSTNGEFDFMTLLDYVTNLKKEFYRPEPTDGDLVRAFVAVGGNDSCEGNVKYDDLLGTCNRFDLNLNAEGFQENSDLAYEQFKTILEDDVGGGEECCRKLKLGLDYESLLEQERKKQEHQKAEMKRRKTRNLARKPSQFNPRSSRANSRLNSINRMMRSDSIVNPRKMSLVEPNTPFPPVSQEETDPNAQSDNVPEIHANDQQETQKKRKLQKKKRKKLKQTQQAMGGTHTRSCGRTGVFVDDSPQQVCKVSNDDSDAQIS